MIPKISELPELRNEPGKGTPALLGLTVFLFFTIALFPHARLYNFLNFFGVMLANHDLEIAHYRRILFLPCLVVFTWSLAPYIRNWLRRFSTNELLNILFLALIVYAILAILAFPYPFPTGTYSHRSGLSAIGYWYGGMAADPFLESNETVYRRLLMAALAHYGGLTYPVDYFLLSQLLSVGVIALSIVFVREQVKTTEQWPLPARLLLYTSLCSSAFVVYNSQMPGYPDILLYTLFLLILLIPMPRHGRLILVALCMVTHDGAIFGLMPLILVAFPKRERWPAILTIGAYYLIWLASYGPGIREALQAHDVVGESSHFRDLFLHPWITLAGVFFTYKILWIPALSGLVPHRKERFSGSDITKVLLLIVAPLAIITVAWDTTRLASFGIAGMLLLWGAVAREYLPKKPGPLVLLALLINLAIPTNNIVLARLDTASSYQYPGGYRYIYNAALHAP